MRSSGGVHGGGAGHGGLSRTQIKAAIQCTLRALRTPRTAEEARSMLCDGTIKMAKMP